MSAQTIKRQQFAPAPCIWCGASDFIPSVEHIMPEALGCPTDFVLTRDVCIRCNSTLAHLDQALLRQFELITFLKGIPRKEGKRPSIDNWASLRGKFTPSGPQLHINKGPGRTTAFGSTLKPISETKEFDDFSFHTQGKQATLKFSQTIGEDPKFIRALYKIGVEVAVFWLGPEIANCSRMTPVKRFVRKSRGTFGTIMMPSTGTRGHSFHPPYRSEDTQHLAIEMTIFGINFLVDLDPKQRTLEAIKQKLYETDAENWTFLPIKA